MCKTRGSSPGTIYVWNNNKICETKSRKSRRINIQNPAITSWQKSIKTLPYEARYRHSSASRREVNTFHSYQHWTSVQKTGSTTTWTSLIPPPPTWGTTTPSSSTPSWGPLAGCWTISDASSALEINASLTDMISNECFRGWRFAYGI